MRLLTVAAILLTAASLLSPYPTAKAQPKERAKHLPSFPIFEDVVPWIRCDTCVHMVGNAYDYIEHIRLEGPPEYAHKNDDGSLKKKPVRREGEALLPPREEVVMEVLETVCNPFNEAGWWIRNFGITLENDGFEARLESLGEWMKCQGHCTTIADACVKVHDTPSLDKLTGYLYKFELSKKKLQEKLCKLECKARDVLKAELEAGLAAMQQGSSSKTPSADATAAKKKKNTKKKSDDFPRKLSKKLLKEKHVPIEEKELDVEEMMDRMGRTNAPGAQKMDVFSRETISEMQAAFMHGTKEQATHFDPQVADLTDEEFLELQAMYRNEKGDEYPDAPDFEAAERERDDYGQPSHKAKGDSLEKELNKKKSTEKQQPAKKPTKAQEKYAAAEEAIMEKINKLSDEEVMKLVEELEREEAAKKGGMKAKNGGKLFGGYSGAEDEEEQAYEGEL